MVKMKSESFIMKDYQKCGEFGWTVSRLRLKGKLKGF